MLHWGIQLKTDRECGITLCHPNFSLRLQLALAIKESFCLTPFVILACIYMFFSFLGAIIYPLVSKLSF